MMQSPYAPMSSIPQAQYQPASPFRCGPLLRYQNLDIHQGIWIGSILVVSRPENQGQPPVLTWSDNKTSQNVTAEVIEGYQHSYFWRYSLRIPQEHQVTKTITYSFNNGPAKWYFYIAGRSETFRWMFYSCNGFSSSTDARALGGANPLWNDMMSKHAVTPYHVMLGGGDQLYCDGLLNEPEMMEWLNLSSTGERERAECTPRWTMAIEKYYFNRYCEWFSSGTYAQALAMIPSVNMWDDHDTIDGYGSYPDSMQNSRVLSKIGEVSRRFYLLFQHHSTPALAPHHGFFSSGIGFNILTSLGPKTSILVLDARSERTKTVVCSNTTYEMAYAKMYQEIPQGTEHLLVLLGVPIAYPRLVFAENLMGSVGSVLGGIAGAAKVVNKLNGEPELLDDLNDHWTAKLHKSERNRFLTKLQEFSNTRRIRVTFLSGDVHCAGVGRFTSKLEPERDPQLMYQIISSAIVNEPPPEGVIKLLHFQDKVHVLEGRVKTYEDMYPIFTNDVDGRPLQMDKLLPRRNYSHGHYNPSTGSLDITIFAENIRAGPDPSGDRGTKPYYISAPRLY
ncbi:hypothetical protein BGX34_010951 [Mortierella sp. NVP85]|nr:hypothetical protein BGX34_010951 [Mortierella sp. NVP85]